MILLFAMVYVWTLLDGVKRERRRQEGIDRSATEDIPPEVRIFHQDPLTKYIISLPFSLLPNEACSFLIEYPPPFLSTTHNYLS